MKQFYPCGLYQYQLTIVGTRDLQPKMVWSPLIATWRVYHLLQAVTSRFAALRQKYRLPSRKIMLLGALTLKFCSQKDFKGPHNNGKDLLTNRKDPWAESKDLNLKGWFFFNYWKINFQRLKLKGPKRTLGTLYNINKTVASQLQHKLKVEVSSRLNISVLSSFFLRGIVL